MFLDNRFSSQVFRPTSLFFSPPSFSHLSHSLPHLHCVLRKHQLQPFVANRGLRISKSSSVQYCAKCSAKAIANQNIAANTGNHTTPQVGARSLTIPTADESSSDPTPPTHTPARIGSAPALLHAHPSTPAKGSSSSAATNSSTKSNAGPPEPPSVDRLSTLVGSPALHGTIVRGDSAPSIMVQTTEQTSSIAATPPTGTSPALLVHHFSYSIAPPGLWRRCKAVALGGGLQHPINILFSQYLMTVTAHLPFRLKTKLWGADYR